MKNLWKQCGWIAATILGSALFAFGFSCFLLPNDISTGGISGLALVAVELLGGGSVGSLSVLINLPLFLIAGLKIGKRFFFGSLTGMLCSSALIDAFALIPMPATEPLIAALSGGVPCGLWLAAWRGVCRRGLYGRLGHRGAAAEAALPGCAHRSDFHVL